MSTVAALLKAIEQDAEDRLPWLVLADWIQERGYEADADRLRDAIPGENALDLLSADGWCEAVADIGVFEESTLDLSSWEREGLTDRGLIALATLRSRQLRWVDVSGAAVSDDAIVGLVQSPGLIALRILHLYGVPLNEGTRAMLNGSRVSCVYYDHPEDPHGNSCCSSMCPGLAEIDFREPFHWCIPRDHRLDRNAKGTDHPGRSRRTWWCGFQVTQLMKRRRLGQ
ncbi:MAG: hypothetical protein C0467_29360 [Planctomycetaceae bacterium]|nr:hypothetical protein [Planctomycetaceae bacterium]